MLPWLIGVVWLMPFLYVGLAVAGWALARRPHRISPSLMIIQITTIGNHAVVNELLATLRSYKLAIPYTLWVVTEPGQERGYIGADEVIVVPASFHCSATHKARALEYSRKLRGSRGLVSDDVKVLFLDDDSVPARSYVEKAYQADFDICEGIVTPRSNYGSLLSHVDDLRTLNCITVCAFFQLIGFPIWVHGEGMCVRTSAEAKVTWDHAIFASEDLVFGHLAAARGLRWGFIRDCIFITSPWSLKDMLRQRRRWLWGNIVAVRSVLPWPSKLAVTTAHLTGYVVYPLSIIGVGFDLAGDLRYGFAVRILAASSLIVWLAVFALIGWMNSGGRPVQALLAAVLLWISSGVTLLLALGSFLMGNPHRFEVIAKSRPMTV